MAKRQDSRKHSQNQPVCKTLISSLMVVAISTICRHQNPHLQLVEAQQFSIEQASKIIGSLLRIDQISACDGEQLQLKCAAEHNIEVLAVEKTILNPSGSKLNQQQLSSSSLSTATLSLGNQKPDQLNDQLTTDAICRPRPSFSIPIQLQQQQQNQTRTTIGNESEQRPSLNGTTYCNLDEKSNQVSSDVQAKLKKLVESECHLKNSCSLDLTWPPRISSTSLASSASSGDKNNTDLQQKLLALLNTTDSRNSTELQQHLISNSTGPILNQFKIAQLLHESDNCPSNRKLLELVYRCRPQRLRTRFACGSTVASLECSESKSLIVSGANYGYHPADKRIHEKCRLSQNNLQSMLPLSPCTSNRSASALMISECSFKRQCRLDVTPHTFGETNCTLASGQSEYLAFMYVCVDDTLINRNSSAYIHWSQQQQAKTNPPQHQQAQPQLSSGSAAPFTSSNVSSSSLLSSPPPMSNSFISPPSGPGGLLNNPFSSSSQTVLNVSSASLSDENDADDNQPPFTISTRVLTVVANDPQLSATNPLNWTPGQRAKFVWLRYQPLVILVAAVSFTMILLAFTVRVCRHQARSRSSKNSSKSSSTSSNKSSTSSDHSGTSCSSSLPVKSLSSNASTLAVGQHHHHHHHQMTIRGGITSDQARNADNCLASLHSNNNNNNSQALKHNSCSDSCFSLDDYNCFNHQVTSTSNNNNNNQSSSQADSPGLQTTNNSTPMLESGAPSDQQQQQPYSAGYMSSARPKFWSFYGNEQNSGSLRLGSAYGHLGNVASQQHQQQQYHAGTMRPTRTFMGQQQQQPQQHPPFVNRLNASQQNEQYLLTMANVMQRNQMGDWPAPNIQQLQQPAQPADGHFNHNHLHSHHHHLYQLDQQDQQAMDALLASLNVAGLDQPSQQHPLLPPTHQLDQPIEHANNQHQPQHQLTCSFHTQQQQQQQQQLQQSQPPNYPQPQAAAFAGPQTTGGSLQLELPSAAGVASVVVGAPQSAAAAPALTPTSQTGAPAAVIIGGQPQ